MESLWLAVAGRPDNRRFRDLAQAARARLESTRNARTAAYGDLAVLDHRTPDDLLSQLRRIELPPLVATSARASQVALGPAPRPGRVKVHVDEVRCVRETRNLPQIEGRDEISLSATLAGVRLETVDRTVDLGKFRRDDARAASPSPFLVSEVTDVTAPDAVATLTLSLSEHDRGNAPPAPLDGVAIANATIVGCMGILAGLSGTIIVAAGSATIVPATVLGPIVLGGLILLGTGIVVGVHVFRRAGVDEAFTPESTPPANVGALVEQPSDFRVDLIADRRTHGFEGHYQVRGRILAEADE